MPFPSEIMEQVLAANEAHHTQNDPSSPTAFTTISLTTSFENNQVEQLQDQEPQTIQPGTPDEENQLQTKPTYPKTPLRSASKAKLINRPPSTPVAQIKYSEETVLALEKARAQLKDIQKLKAVYASKSAELAAMLSNRPSKAPLSPSPLDHFEVDEIPIVDDSDEQVDVNAPLTSEVVRGCFVHSFHSDKSAQPAFVRFT